MWSACITEKRYIAITAHCSRYIQHGILLACMSESDVFVTFIFRFICLVLVCCWPISICHLVYSGFTISFSPVSIQCNVFQHCCCLCCTLLMCAVLDLLLHLDCLCAQSQCFIITIYVSWVECTSFFFVLRMARTESEKLMVFCVCHSGIVNYEGIISAKTKTNAKAISTAPKKRENCNRIWCV